MNKTVDKNKINVPQLEVIPVDDLELPYFLVIDKIFPLKKLANETIFFEKLKSIKLARSLTIDYQERVKSSRIILASWSSVRKIFRGQ